MERKWLSNEEREGCCAGAVVSGGLVVVHTYFLELGWRSGRDDLRDADGRRGLSADPVGWTGVAECEVSLTRPVGGHGLPPTEKGLAEKRGQ